MGNHSLQCCGRPMTAIGVAGAAPSGPAPAGTLPADVVLHTCAACGRHGWSGQGRELGRDELLAALRGPAAGPAARPGRADPPAVAARTGEVRRRTELQQMLRGFTVHGTTS